jgi:hypothetical protein
MHVDDCDMRAPSLASLSQLSAEVSFFFFCYSPSLHVRNLAVALMLFFMRIEVARARANEGFRSDEREGPANEEVMAAERARVPDRAAARIYRAGKLSHSVSEYLVFKSL